MMQILNLEAKEEFKDLGRIVKNFALWYILLFQQL